MSGLPGLSGRRSDGESRVDGVLEGTVAYLSSSSSSSSEELKMTYFLLAEPRGFRIDACPSPFVVVGVNCLVLLRCGSTRSGRFEGLS